MVDPVWVSRKIVGRILLPRYVSICETQILYSLSVLVDPGSGGLCQVVIESDEWLVVTPAVEVCPYQVRTELLHSPDLPQTLPLYL